MNKFAVFSLIVSLLLTGCSKVDVNEVAKLAAITVDGPKGNLTINWNLPVENTDKTPLIDLAGFRILYGTSPGVYTGSVNGGVVSSCTLQNLVKGRKYYLAVKAINTSGAESEASTEIVKVVP